LNVTKNAVESSLPVLIFEFAIDPTQFRGCSLYDPILSIIILSSADSPNGRRFTLTHELVHLLTNESGLCDPMSTGTPPEVERHCDALAAEALIPADLLGEELARLQSAPIGNKIRQLVARFGISYSAAAVRLHETGNLDRAQMLELVAFYRVQWASQRQEQSEGEGGPNYHLLQVQRLGPTFTSTVLEGIQGDHISLTRGAGLLGVATSHRSFDGIRARMSSVYGGS
jgi:Zn-dependent peptidase ImmA (M78 family)